MLSGVNIDDVTISRARDGHYSGLVPESREELTMEGGLEAIQLNVGQALLVLQRSVKSDKQLMNEAHA